jgi:CDP-diacylglycerol--glycerol-3-phosphate 3-phosphatidyltransferase
VAAARTAPGFRAQIPNALTLGRLVVIPVYALLLLSSRHGFSWPAAVVFGAAGVTDQLDGYLARRWHVESAFGKIADPLADRLLIDLAVVLLWHAGRLPWAALVIPGRDIFVMVMTPPLLRRGYRFEVNALGKLATWLLYLSLGLVMVVHRGSWPRDIFWAGLALALVSLALYALKARRETRTDASGGGPSDGRGGGGDAARAVNATVDSQVEVDG